MRLLALLALLAASLTLSPGASAYRAEGRAWPSGVVPYYNAAADQAWSVAQAVNVWNTSGARIRFVAVPLERAKLVIRSTGRTTCAKAHATVGHVARATVWIWRSGAAASDCDPYWTTSALTHELGHVLGLGHEERGCAAMNPSGSRLGPSSCTRAEPWQWRCRLLEHDDVAGAVALYGGTLRAPRRDAACNLYRPLAAPDDVAAKLDGDVLRVSLRRPASPLVPAFLAPRSNSESYVVAWGGESCSSTFEPTSPRYRWTVGIGEVDEIARRVPSGARCLSIWAVDGLGRPSASPVSITL